MTNIQYIQYKAYFSTTNNVITPLLNSVSFAYTLPFSNIPPSIGNLNNVIIGPNPFKPNAQNNVVTFYNLTPEAEIKIYTITGLLVTDLKKNDNTRTYIWDGKDSHGRLLAPGIYICYFVNSNGQNNHLQLAIQR